MCKLILAGILVFTAIGFAAAEPAGLVTKPAKYPVAEAAERLEKVLVGAGLTVFAVIDHAAAAEKSGLSMPPARVVIFGNPKGGTPMMRTAPTIAIDLPLKVLVWEDAAGKAWVSHNTASYIAGRHALNGMDKMVQGLDAALNKLTAAIIEAD